MDEGGGIGVSEALLVKLLEGDGEFLFSVLIIIATWAKSCRMSLELRHSFGSCWYVFNT
jgi:hypothetical protein